MLMRSSTTSMRMARRRSFECSWWRSDKARPVFLTGSLLAAAFAASLIAPELSNWTYVTVALVGLVPFARRAFVLARLGSPFSIETLMSVAAIGALAVGEAALALHRQSCRQPARSGVSGV